MIAPAASVVTTRLDGDVAVLHIDSPPVNALDAVVREALAAAVRESASDPKARAIVLACAGRTFVAGADIAELERAAWGDGEGPDMSPLLTAVEQCPKPVVAAIHGTALGGGLELAMACHYRVAATDAKLGLPEITLGVIPGAGGTQRLPRIIGAIPALDMMISGAPVDAAAAKRLGLIDAVIDGDLHAGAQQFCEQLIEQGA